jgi:hypothetical protein
MKKEPTQNQPTQNFNPNWDKLKATYYWRINLDPDYKGVRPNRQAFIIGYSKKIGQSENSDKELLFRKKVTMLWQNGYLEKCTSIEFYARYDVYINKATDPRMVELYPTFYNIPEASHDWIYPIHGEFLHEFYECIKAKKDPLYLSASKHSPVPKDEYLNPGRFHYRHVSEVYAHAARASEMGFAIGQVDAFVRTYKLLKGWN